MVLFKQCQIFVNFIDLKEQRTNLNMTVIAMITSLLITYHVIAVCHLFELKHASLYWNQESCFESLYSGERLSVRCQQQPLYGNYKVIVTTGNTIYKLWFPFLPFILLLFRRIIVHKRSERQPKLQVRANRPNCCHF